MAPIICYVHIFPLPGIASPPGIVECIDVHIYEKAKSPCACLAYRGKRIVRIIMNLQCNQITVANFL